MIDIKIIKHQGHSALVEYIEQGITKRVTIPANTIKDDQASKRNLDLGISYGVAWSVQVKLSASSEKLEQELHRVGIWTAEDALNNAQKVQGAILATYMMDLSRIMAIAKQAREE